jgi:uncharacterized protein
MAKRRDENEPVAGPQEQTETADRPQSRRRGGYQRQSVGEAIAKSFIRSIASSLGRILARAITGRMR